MARNFEALEADFQAHYGLDLREALWGVARIGARRLRALAQGLPRGSATHRALDPRGWDWTNGDELLAILLRRFGVTVKTPAEQTSSAPRKKSSTAELKRFFGDAIEYTEG